VEAVMLSDPEKRVLAAIEAEPLYRLTAELVRRPSVSGDEKTVADFIANYLSDHGFAVDTDEIEPGRPNVTTSWGNDDGKVLLLTGHTDTVPIGEGWQHDPLGAEIVDGRLYGRGSCDMKAGLAGMMMALIAAKRGLQRPRGRIVFAGCIDEEEGGKGTQGAIRAGLKADWAVIGEPTDLQPICAAKGNCYFEVKVGGSGAHAGSPERGVNAIYGAAEAIRAVQSHQAELSRRRHGLLGSPSVSVGTIKGGLTVSAVPDQCSFLVDRRLLPEETGESALAEFSHALHRHPASPQGVTVTERLAMEMPSMETPRDHPLVAALARAARDAGAPDLAPGGWSAACDGGFLQRDAAVPVVLFGPGSIVNQAHRPDEFVPLEETLIAARAYAVLAVRALGGDQD
jgi:acetylornithine deacetylase/succinyl-diaminopimelate desuccinylase family protein